MTPITHKIEETGIELVFVPMPEGHIGIQVSMGYLICKCYNMKNWVFDQQLGIWKYKLDLDNEPNDYKDIPILLPQGNDWLPLGLLKDLKEKDVASVMPKIILDNEPTYYKCFTERVKGTTNPKAALHSLMKSLKLYTENPYGEKCPSLDDYDISQASQDCMDVLEMEIGMNREQWQQAQQRVIKDAAVLFRKID